MKSFEYSTYNLERLLINRSAVKIIIQCRQETKASLVLFNWSIPKILDNYAAGTNIGLFDRYFQISSCLKVPFFLDRYC
jgi:hypothetical protein